MQRLARESSLFKGIARLNLQSLDTHENKTPGEAYLAAALELWLAICSISLIASTAGLWFPTWLAVDFPASAFIDGLQSVPLGLDCWLSVALLIGWILIALSGCFSIRRGSTSNRKLVFAASTVVFVSGIALVVLNQHRLQPWHYQGLLFLLILRITPLLAQRQQLQWLVISIYFYSAVSKSDFQFAHTVGQDLLQATLQFFPGLGDTEAYWRLVWVIPAVELFVAFLLVFPKTRLLGAFMACCLHGVLVIILGPAGLGHSLGVLIWNAHFIGVILLLFVAPLPAAVRAEMLHDTNHSGASPVQNAGLYLTRFVIGAAMLMPLTERLGFWDHWPSWALYAPHSSRVEVRISTTSTERLPESLQDCLAEFREEDLWVRVPIAAWSLEQTGAPIYPQARFQWAIATQIARHIDSDFEIQAEYWPTASRWTGEREKSIQTGSSDIRQFASHFRLGCQPRVAQPLKTPANDP
ncbi:MAG: MauE/DoxX family redox-associated membrane protein [Aureliella sp.]